MNQEPTTAGENTPQEAGLAPAAGQQAPAQFDFAYALTLLKEGKRAYRQSWNGVQAGKKMYLAIQEPDAQSANTLPYIYIVTEQGRVPWVASQSDLLADDWAISN